MMIDDNTSVINITGVPLRNQSPGVMARLGSPSSFARRSEIVTINTLAVEPKCVPLPPMPTPIASAHHNGVTLMPCVSNPRIIGIIAAVNGILSIAADMTAEPHISMIAATIRSETTYG